VLGKIDELVTEMRKFDLVVRVEAPTQALYRQTHSALHESKDIFGREDDKEVVVKLLLNQQDQQDVQVLPIIGMGGVGKTTLAKMVYNNHRIQKHFELLMWHCVSENFEAIPLVRL
jgi:polynucleotide 5'-kinase involved in rRNA processing